MEKKYLDILEFPKVLAKLATYTSFSAGQDLALNLDVSDDLEEARRRQRETTEARQLFASKTDVSLGGAHDVRPLVERAQRNSRLMPQELLDIHSTIMASWPVHRTLGRLSGQYPLLSTLASCIDECKPIAMEITRCITPKGEVADGASPELSRIRGEMNVAHGRLMQRLERYLTSTDTATYLQEPLVTQRDGRYVIPIRAECRGRIPGLVHDESASGATVFIEPLATVELNNVWREWQIKEEREIARILDGLTALVAKEATAIQRTVDTLAELDLIFARAQYAADLNAVEPDLLEYAPRQVLDEQQGIYHPGARLRLLRARHPLLNQERVVPIDAYFKQGKQGFFVLVVTGPNTGGKTVVLKTVGLLSLMAQAGLHIPAAEGSTLCIFDSIYADIGDEQSIEQSLSTFSAHMSNIVHILSQVTDHSLVLLDELGAGTDPVEGSALARSLLSELVLHGVPTLATTHHPELKVFAQSTPGVENASVEFDSATLAPTYELSIGLPGRSNAFAIAERLGLKRSIVARAQTLVDPRSLQADDLLREIKELRSQAQRQIEELQVKQEKVAAQEAELNQQLVAIEANRNETINQIRGEAEREFGELRKEISIARTELARLRSRGHDSRALSEALTQLENTQKQLAQDMSGMPAASVSAPFAANVGDYVWIKSLQAQGVVTARDGNQAEVRVGSLRLRVVLDDLEAQKEIPPAAESGTTRYTRAISIDSAPATNSELHLRGMRVEEALPMLDRYLNDAYLSGLQRVRIVHGKGTGTLRRLVREELSRHPLVLRVQPAGNQEGGEGVTIAELSSR